MALCYGGPRGLTHLPSRNLTSDKCTRYHPIQKLHIADSELWFSGYKIYINIRFLEIHEQRPWIVSSELSLHTTPQHPQAHRHSTEQVWKRAGVEVGSADLQTNRDKAEQTGPGCRGVMFSSIDASKAKFQCREGRSAGELNLK